MICRKESDGYNVSATTRMRTHPISGEDVNVFLGEVEGHIPGYGRVRQTLADIDRSVRGRVSAIDEHLKAKVIHGQFVYL